MQFSDERLKTNITDLIDALEIVTKLQGNKIIFLSLTFQLYRKKLSVEKWCFR